MESETLRKAVEKASFDMLDVLIISDGTTATIKSKSADNSRITHVEFPCDVEGEWGITDPSKLISRLKKIKGAIKILPKKDALFISGGSRKFKCPIADGPESLCSTGTLTPTRDGNNFFLNGQPAATLPVVFSIADPSKFKKDYAGEDEYKKDTKITFKTLMNVYGEDTADYSLGDSIDGEYLIPFTDIVSAYYNGLDVVVKILGKDHITVCMGQDTMMVIEDVDGDVKSTFVIAQLDK